MKLEDCKPGLRVAVYEPHGRYVACIERIDEDRVYVNPYFKPKDLVPSHNVHVRVHPKQLRRLKPKEKKQDPTIRNNQVVKRMNCFKELLSIAFSLK